MIKGTQPFPFHRLPRLNAADLALVQNAPSASSLEVLGQVAGELMSNLGLGGAELCIQKVRAMHLEELRGRFPGRWPFACFADLKAERAGALALDPLLVGRLLQVSCKDGGKPNWQTGGRGVLAAIMAAGLERLVSGDGRWQGWRYAGLLDSAGDLGRTFGDSDRLLASWVQVRMGWDEGCVVWLEPERSAMRTVVSREPASLPSWFPLIATERLAACELSMGELRATGPGDVLLFEEQEPCLCVGPVRIFGKRDGRFWQVQQMCLVQTGGEEMGQFSQTMDMQGLDSVDPSSLPMGLVIETGRCQLTVAKVAGLRSGDVLELGEPLMGALEIRCADRMLGRGELVDVEGRRGLRITEWLLTEPGS